MGQASTSQQRPETREYFYASRWLVAYWHPYGAWVRLGRNGRGLCLWCAPPGFCERKGYKRTLPLWGQWKLLYLPATKGVRCG